MSWKWWEVVVGENVKTEWPTSPPCPDCECCTEQLCRRAREWQWPCSTVQGAGRGEVSTVGCPCSPRHIGRPPSPDAGDKPRPEGG